MAPISRPRYAAVVLSAALCILSGVAAAQDSASAQVSFAEGLPAPHSAAPNFGIVQDWSTQHVLFPRNGSVEDMLKVRNDPRFLNSILLRYAREHASWTQAWTGNGPTQSANEANLAEDSAGEDNASADAEELEPPILRKVPRQPLARTKNKHSKVDWSVSLGTTFGMAIGESPAFYGASAAGTPTCTTSKSQIGDFIVYSLKAVPSSTQANLVGITNLYSGSSPTGICGSAPTILFSYDIGTGGSLLSPVLSLDGTKVAWITNIGTTQAVFHVTTWAYGQGTSATAPVAVGSGSSDVAINYTSSANTTCTASEDTNTNSEIYVDYPSDTAFVGADNGILYHLHGIFKGTPTFDFCTTVNASAGTGLSGPVYDSLLSPPEVFITDSETLYSYSLAATSPTSFTKVATYVFGKTTNGTYTGPGPVLDAFNKVIYVFSADDKNGNSSVTQLPLTLASATNVPLGTASSNSYSALFYGAFDNNYNNNGPTTGSTLYSCGGYSGNTAAQALYAIGFTSSGTLNTTPIMPANINVDPPTATPPDGSCSPITEFFDGSHDRIFVGMGEHVATTGANVVEMWDVTKQLTSASDTYTAIATDYAGGSSGIIADYASTAAQSESVYFTTLAPQNVSGQSCPLNDVCAVKLTQGALQ